MAWRDYRDLMRQMDYDMHRFTEEAFGFLETANRFWQPNADIHETDTGIVIKMEVAGVSADSVQVSLSGDARRLLVSGVRAESATERVMRTGCHQLEVYFGPFERTFTLPGDFDAERDAIAATLKDGFLTITLPSRIASPVSRPIPIEIHIG
ncbi:MAG: Hsp20/alpha crystallin family protein [Armatimonadetes bacterium]|nr:Hsp20/alpha crystallin family protein [Armatimonadota bacterium]